MKKKTAGLEHVFFIMGTFFLIAGGLSGIQELYGINCGLYLASLTVILTEKLKCLKKW